MIENRLKSIFRASIIAIVVNIAIGIFKAIVGIISNSIAITMDAINNFTDAGSSLITILSSYFAAKDPDKKHPFGYGRTEYLGTLLIGMLILYAGVTALVESVKQIISPEAAAYSIISLVIIAVTVVVKIGLAAYIVKVGKQTSSDSLIASGKEAIGDIAVSIATIVAALIFIFTNISIEAWLAAVIAIMIIRASVETLKETVGKILGTGGDVNLVKDVKKTIAEHEDVRGAYDLVLHNYGPDSYLASVHIEVLDNVSINRFDEITRELQNIVFDKFGIYLAAVGVYSVNTEDDEVIAIRDDVTKTVLQQEYVNQVHGFYIDKIKKIIRFDLVVSFDAKDRRKVQADVMKMLQTKYKSYSITAGLDSDYNEI